MTCSDFYTVHSENSMASYIKASTSRILDFLLSLIILLEKRNVRIFEVSPGQLFSTPVLGSSCYQDSSELAVQLKYIHKKNPPLSGVITGKYLHDFGMGFQKTVS